MQTIFYERYFPTKIDEMLEMTGKNSKCQNNRVPSSNDDIISQSGEISFFICVEVFLS